MHLVSGEREKTRRRWGAVGRAPGVLPGRAVWRMLWRWPWLDGEVEGAGDEDGHLVAGDGVFGIVVAVVVALDDAALDAVFRSGRVGGVARWGGGEGGMVERRGIPPAGNRREKAWML